MCGHYGGNVGCQGHFFKNQKQIGTMNHSDGAPTGDDGL
jgi:hypothetical protein